MKYDSNILVNLRDVVTTCVLATTIDSMLTLYLIPIYGGRKILDVTPRKNCSVVISQ